MTEYKPKPLKKPWLAAFLNALPIFGLGYLYVGHWTAALSVFGLQILGPMVLSAAGLHEYRGTFVVILWFISIVDAHRRAKIHNRFIQIELDARTRFAIPANEQPDSSKGKT